jgi:outer membrane protein TolC
MKISPTLRPASERRHSRHHTRFLAVAAMLLLCGLNHLNAQVSIVTAIDLAIRNSPRVKTSESDVTKARAAIAESKDVYVPSIAAGAGLGQAYGYSPYPPTLFTISSSSLVYSSSQFSYIDAARAGMDAALQALADMRETVAEDAALTFLAVDHDQQREEVLRQEAEHSARLLQIVQDRFDAGQDSSIDLTNAKLATKRLRVAQLRAADDTATDRGHLARLIGVNPDSLRAEGGFPAAPVPAAEPSSPGSYANSAVASAFANAKAKQLQAHGDSHFLYRPQISFVAQYNRYATFTNAFKSLQKVYGGLTADDEAFGVQISIPILDRLRQSKAIESSADATHALHDAEFAQFNVLDAQTKLSHSIDVLQAQAEVAGLEQQLSQQQLEIVQLQLKSANASPQPMTPKDEQNARLAEREKYLAVVDNSFQLHQAEVSLLRQTGHLEDWLRHAGITAVPASPPTRQTHP